jgi:hypothetical protein
MADTTSRNEQSRTLAEAMPDTNADGSYTYRPATVPCGLCGKATRMTGTKRCDGCWELESRIQGDPALAARILASLTNSEKGTVREMTPADMANTLREAAIYLAENQQSNLGTDCQYAADAIERIERNKARRLTDV